VSCLILQAAEDCVDLSLGPGAALAPGQEVEVFFGIGPALCAGSALVADLQPPLARLGQFREFWRARKREETRHRVVTSIRFGYLPGRKAGGDGEGGLTLAGLHDSLRPAYEGDLRDLSMGGCRLVTRETEPFEAPGLIRVSLRLPAGGEPVPLLGMVVGTGGLPGGERRLNVQFFPLAREVEIALLDAVRQWESAAVFL